MAENNARLQFNISEELNDTLKVKAELSGFDSVNNLAKFLLANYAYNKISFNFGGEDEQLKNT